MRTFRMRSRMPWMNFWATHPKSIYSDLCIGVRTMRTSKGCSCESTLGFVRNYAVGKTVAKPVNLSRFAVMKSASAPVRSSVPNESRLTLALYVGL